MKNDNWKEQLRSNPVPGVVNKPGVNIQDLIKRIEELEQQNKHLVEITSLDTIKKEVNLAMDKEIDLLKSALLKIEDLESRLSKLSPKTNIPKVPTVTKCSLWGAHVY